MRVCFISFEYPPNILGGAGTYAESIVDGLRDKGVDVLVVTTGDQNDFDQKTFGVPTSNVEYWRRLFFMNPATGIFHKLNRLHKFDLVHLNEPHIILRKLGLPTVCTLHSTQVNEIKLKLPELRALKNVNDIKDLVLKGSVGSLCDIVTVQNVDRIICPSPHLTRLIESYCFVDRERISVIPNGIDLKAFDSVNADGEQILSEYGLHKDNYILFMGRLTFHKGVHLLIEAFTRLKKEHSNMKLVIAGTGNSESYLKAIANDVEDIVFTGFVDSLASKKALYENCLVVVVPSFYEGLPMVILEAMACGKAIVASGVGGVPLLVRHGRNGFCSKPGDSQSLERFIQTLLEDANLRESMGSSGRKLAEKEFTVDKMVNRTLRVYQSLCS